MSLHSNLHPEFSSSQGATALYHVQVGHTTTTVQGRSVADAISQARRRLCQEMPRMWDMIQSLDDSRFIVVPVK